MRASVARQKNSASRWFQCLVLPLVLVGALVAIGWIIAEVLFSPDT